MINLNENSDLSFDTQSYNSFNCIFSLDSDIGNKLKKEFNCLEQSSKGNNFGIGKFSVNSEQNGFIFYNDPQQNKHELSEKKNTPKFTTKKKEIEERKVQKIKD